MYSIFYLFYLHMFKDALNQSMIYISKLFGLIYILEKLVISILQNIIMQTRIILGVFLFRLVFHFVTSCFDLSQVFYPLFQNTILYLFLTLSQVMFCNSCLCKGQYSISCNCLQKLLIFIYSSRPGTLIFHNNFIVHRKNCAVMLNWLNITQIFQKFNLKKVYKPIIGFQYSKNASFM